MKRLMDIVLVLLTLPLWLPLLILTLLIVAVFLGRPVFFRQKRAGLHGEVFEIIKFRTMKDLQDDSGQLLPDEQRMTRCGKILRNLSADELPELMNVLKGEMSLVGPRPLPVIYVPRYSREQARRLECLPGITGWAQVNGRNLLDWEERFQHDVWYVENKTLWLDITILWKTIMTVLSREGISGEDVATMTEFMGAEGARDLLPAPGSNPPDSRDPSRRIES